MNKNFQNYYKNIIIYDLITKHNFTNIFEIPKINKISLNIGYKNINIDKKKLINILILLKLITNQNAIVTKSKKNNIFLKIKKNSIIGCKLTLRKQNIYVFLNKLVIFLLSNMNKIKFNFKSKNIINFKINNILNIIDLKTEFLKFKDLPYIDISIHTNSKNNKQLYSLLNYLLIIKN